MQPATRTGPRLKVVDAAPPTAGAAVVAAAGTAVLVWLVVSAVVEGLVARDVVVSVWNSAEAAVEDARG